MSAKPTFVLGIGCQKAGTTWLWNYLQSFPTVALTRPKELHVFDAMLRPEIHADQHLKAKVQNLSRSPLDRLKARLKKPAFGYVAPERRVEMVRNPQVYVDHFSEMASSVPVVGEITPSYCTLGEDDFRRIRAWLEPHFDLRLVLLLRDPVTRGFSAAKHYIRKNRPDYPIALDVEANAYFEKIYTSPYLLERHDYEPMLKRLDAAFEPGTVHVEFYERLFSPEAVRKVTDFLGLPAKEAPLRKEINKAQESRPLDPALAARARSAYAPTYTYCEERFGKALIEELWTAAV